MKDLAYVPGVLRAWWKFRTYKPSRVTPSRIFQWLRQYPSEHRGLLLRLLNLVEYLGEEEIERALVEANAGILDRLAADGIGVERVIYVQHDEAGSSSPVMLNLLRDAARLERSGARFVDGRDQNSLSKVTAELGTGAIIYVDDFAGTGNQLVNSRNWAAQFVAGSFSEFFLGVVVCEEARDAFEAAQIAPVASRTHLKVDRPLHEGSSLISDAERRVLRDLGQSVFGRYSLGFRNLGTNVVLYRNAPNSTPVLLRGNVGQAPNFGVIPRTSDFNHVGMRRDG